ncbi:type I pullulanase [Streptococcus oricebi]|uniref:Type I pullulanase n=1 Tax=Streptococcus oricebi TaxID=1547447 RepID=A0ABS5B4Y7_9STRE|nr:type I pullulanase [Streptococcus oricebi]MBP2623908.1 type I pullulanase [Streptococcus oricebi]
MALRRFQAYLDDENLIHLYLDQKEADSDLDFVLENQEVSLPLTIKKIEKKDQQLVYSLTCPQKFDWTQSYQVLDQDRNRCRLLFGKLVRQPSFDAYFDYAGDDLGNQYKPEATRFKLWAPISEQVLLRLQAPDQKEMVYPLQGPQRGVWSLEVAGDLEGYRYTYLHKVNGDWQEVHDPYALASTANSGASFVIDPRKLLSPDQIGRAQSQLSPSKAFIYELSIRDFSMQKEAGFQHPGKFLAMTESPQVQGEKLGFAYLKSLGISHVQIMPLYDFGSVDEVKPQEVYNWGYDPVQYNIPDGSFASNPHDPYCRILELQEMVARYHQADLSLIMDVVYNHVYEADSFAFEKILPGYFYRYQENGEKTNGTFCGNDVASERRMVRRYIKHSLKQWLTLYGFDGFRFDLMGILDKETMLEVASELKALYPNVYLYGEGWDMATGLAREELAHQFNANQLAAYGFFSDHFRNSIKETIAGGRAIQADNNFQLLENVLTANLGLKGASHFLEPQQAINYTECHDNATVFDYLKLENPQISPSQRLAGSRLALHLVLLAQGVPFIHSGQEFFRSKNLIDNSYNLPDTINQLDWQASLEHKKDIDFFRQLIAFRKAHPLLSLESRSAILESCQLTWLNDQVLDYQIKQGTEKIRILINFGDQEQVYQNEEAEALYISYPAISLKQPLERPAASYKVPPQQFILLKAD